MERALAFMLENDYTKGMTHETAGTISVLAHIVGIPCLLLLNRPSVRFPEPTDFIQRLNWRRSAMAALLAKHPKRVALYTILFPYVVGVVCIGGLFLFVLTMNAGMDSTAAATPMYATLVWILIAATWWM